MRLRVATSTLSFPLFALAPLALSGCAASGGPVDGSGIGVSSAGASAGTTGGGTTSVGQGGTPVGQGGTTPVGQGGTTPVGQGGTTPVGQGGTTPVGQGGTAPVGQGGTAPVGQGGTTPVGQGGVTTGGQAGMTTGGTTTGGAGGAGASGGASTGAMGEWGLVEDPGAGCTVPELVGYDELTADSKLPDPFTKIDGSPITTKAEWKCRREEILKQAFEYIYGDKPIPPEGSVSGSVSSSSISVDVTDGEGTSFSVSVDMNGATAPAPAIILYASGAPVPSGVAKINFSPLEVAGGSGDKEGSFFEAYGADHPAGYLVAWAWQISRIIDVLEQDPSVIDPTRIGVSGCSRYGKGAFVAGVLDNRVALTIPVESGLGGTIGLRLVEILGGGEWPYHGISYVRWMSEVALGPFTNANSAGGDNTDRLPVDMHEMMGLIAPRGLYIVDNPSTMYEGLDRQAAWVTANVGQLIFEALGVGDHMAYEGASGSHCQWRGAYDASLNAMVDKFLKGNDAATTGNFNTDLPNAPNPDDHHDWSVPTLSGDL